MPAVHKARIVKIGNSQGVRIPKLWVEQLALTEEVEMAVQADRIIIRSACRPRQRWDAQFRAMAAQGDDRLLNAHTPTRWDKDEWEW